MRGQERIPLHDHVDRNSGGKLAAGATGGVFGGGVGSPGSGTTVTEGLDDLTDVTITTPVIADRLRYDGSTWVNSNLVWEPIFDNAGTAILDANGDPVMQEVAI